MESFEYTIHDVLGLHARSAGVLVKRLKPVESKVTVTCGNRSASAKTIFALMGMAIKCGETVTVIVEGGDEKALKGELLQFFKDHF